MKMAIKIEFKFNGYFACNIVVFILFNYFGNFRLILYLGQQKDLTLFVP